MTIDANEYLLIRNDLQRALAQDQFVLHYQPQIDLASGRVVGVEALIRWNHPDHGLLSPDRFIPIAEDSGLIVPIGDWVLKEACRQASAWRKAGLPRMVMAVNLSAVQFRQGDLLAGVAQALASSGLDPGCLDLELTESILIKDTEAVLLTIKRLKEFGVKLSIDDFGTGYSSFAYLKKFDVDKIKIDQSFVREITMNANNQAIVRAIVQMADALDVKTIAEGVEDGYVVDLLRDHGCDQGQGYHFAKPMPPEAFPPFLGARGESPGDR
jgi:EAL domain-containing protein (putative c-di-GMP-specific phosphodiesterase class I)